MHFKLGLHTHEEQLEAVDLAADAFARGRQANQEANFFGVSKEIGYLQAIQDLAMDEGAMNVASIAEQEKDELLQAFADAMGNAGVESVTLGMHSKKEQREAREIAISAYSRGVDADRNGNPIGITAEMGYLRAILDLLTNHKVKDLIPLVRRQIEDLDRRFQKYS